MGKRRRGLTGVIKAAKVSRADSELEMLRRQTKSLKRSLTANEAVDGDIRDTFSNTRTDSAAAKSSGKRRPYTLICVHLQILSRTLKTTCHTTRQVHPLRLVTP